MAIEMIQDFEIFDGVLNAGRWSDLKIYMVDDEDMRDRFLERVIEENVKNKSELRELLGGKKLYTIVKETRPNVNYTKINELFCKSVNDTREKVKLGTNIWHVENRQIRGMLDEIYRFSNIMEYGRTSSASDEDILNVLKKEYFYNENIIRMRNIPKSTRLFRTIFDGIIARWSITENYEPIVAQIMDELGRKPKNYILELSTDAIDILTCSVSDNFTSCFNIVKGGCNLASPNYLAIDRTTAVLKLYDLNDTNISAMKSGHLDYNKAIARAFVSYDVDDNKRMVIGRLYPDNKILDYDSLKTILFPLLQCKDTSKGEWVEDMIINYGNNYVGYADYNESRNVGYMATSNCKRLNVGDMGMVFYNKFTDTFDVSTTYYLQTGYMWSLTHMSQNKLERDWSIKMCPPDKEEIENSIVDTTNNIATMIDRRFIDDTPFYEIRDVNRTFSISTGVTDYITGINAEQEIADRLNRIQIQAEDAYELWYTTMPTRDTND